MINRDSIRTRASARCEYCHLPDFSLGPSDFHVEHVIPRKHSGSDEMENLAWACIFCNLYKGSNLAGFDPANGELTRLFHPRKDNWDEHFHMRNDLITGNTAIGRTTISVLEMNSPILVRLRASLRAENRW